MLARNRPRTASEACTVSPEGAGRGRAAGAPAGGSRAGACVARPVGDLTAGRGRFGRGGCGDQRLISMGAASGPTGVGRIDQARKAITARCSAAEAARPRAFKLPVRRLVPALTVALAEQPSRRMVAQTWRRGDRGDILRLAGGRAAPLTLRTCFSSFRALLEARARLVCRPRSEKTGSPSSDRQTRRIASDAPGAVLC